MIFFDSLFASALFIDPSSSTNQTWAQIVAQQQPTPEQQQQSATTTKPSTTEPDPSLLRKLCDESPSSLSQQNNTVKRKNDFVHSLLFASFVCPLNDNDK